LLFELNAGGVRRWGAWLRIRYLDGLRGVAIAMVVLFHAFKDAHPQALISRYGLMGVELFFMISGFVILLTLEKCHSFTEFFGRRWLRLWPAMLIACLFTMALFWIYPPVPAGASIFPGITLIDDRWYSWLFNSKITSINGSYWTLYVEMRFYVLFGAIYFLWGARPAILALVLLSLFYLALLATGHGMGVWRYTDPRYEAWFAAGACFYVYVKERREIFFLAALSAGLLAAWIYYPSIGPRMFGVALVAVFAMTVRVSLAQKLLANKPLVWLGAVSYPLYLIHEPVIGALGPVFGIAASLVFAHFTATRGEPIIRAALSQKPSKPAPAN
jgi:peptidoglycan/LPS O-acetylase OafA/YrhL